MNEGLNSQDNMIREDAEQNSNGADEDELKGDLEEAKKVIFNEVWLKRGTNSKVSEIVKLPTKWKSGDGLPLFIALKESSLFMKRFDEYYDDGTQRKNLFCLGLFEDKTLGGKKENIVPVGYIYLQEIASSDQTQMVCSDRFTMGASISTTIDAEGMEVSDPLFSKLVELKHVPLVAISVGSNETYKDRRDRVISKLKLSKSLREEDRLLLEEMIENPRAIKSGGSLGNLEDFLHTHLGLGQLLLDGAIDICKRTGYDKLYIKATNKESQNLVSRSPFKYREEIVRGSKNLIVDVT